MNARTRPARPIALAGCAALLTANLAVAAGLPAGDAFDLCYGFGCRHSAEVRLQAEDWDALDALFAGAGDAAAERRAIAVAVALLERLSGAQTGTGGDRGGNVEGAGLPGQMDCIDESTNTTAYLSLLTARGLLRWHRVDDRAYRAPWLFDQHWSATVVERDGGGAWAVDSWFLDNGRRPYVQRLEDWRRKAPLPAHPDLDAGPG